MIGALAAGLLAGYGIAVPVGAVATYLVALTARTSLKIGACAALGVATADGLYALIAAFGGAALVPTIKPIMLPLRYVSALVLLVLAVRSGVSAIRRHREHKPTTRTDEVPLSPARAYAGLLGITMMNPMTVIYFAALVLGSRSTAVQNHFQQAAFVLAAFVASASWQLFLASGGALLGRTLTGTRGRLMTALGSSTLITALAAHLLITAL
ncbi:lysine transporter LysE [Streptomyces sp. IMTB 2501]|uniref:LysE family transporter n=1 Tax=Streptomyces sp. IMTB 2501 TaxID=1776340 RepID=UPI00096EC114|nr:LysE family transporter [Streptomyces sp. IMTB 2501]OLZ74669.1 lysine transporter LysE [Streptomyces sp. IMTB 2501]